MTSDLLLEIGTEEIPAAFMPAALSALQNLLQQELAAARIPCAQVRACGTPRRLVLMAWGMAQRQPDLVTRKIGPAARIAYDAEGNLTKAALGFARGQGVDPACLQTVETDKGAYVCADVQETGAPTAALLPELLPRIIRALPFPKSMRWADIDVRFARPVHWILALFGGQTISFAFGGVESGNTTRGHRFMAPEPVAVDSIEAYRAAMQRAHVIIDPAERLAIIAAEGRALARSVQGDLKLSPDLLQEVSFLVEYPFPVLGSFDRDFLELPPEVLMTSMEKHQKYFPVVDAQGVPLPYFVAVNNTRPTDPGIVISGHARVLRARLSDARFFYTTDRKKSLDAMADQLRQVVFQARLGTSHEKVLRFQQLALALADALGLTDRKPAIQRACVLCKADLVSEMVGEFPELQGVMGREYARLAGEPDAVSQAVFEHYLPRFAGDRLPDGDAGAVISIADKLDTIAGCFSLGLVPTGTADPYALRRQCLGIINIILEKRYRLSLVRLTEAAVSLLQDKATRPAGEVRADVLQFFSGRLSNLLTGQGLPADAVEAVVSLGIDDLSDCASRIAALQAMKQDPHFEALAVSFKRVVNILAGRDTGPVDTGLFQHDAERALHAAHLALQDRVRECMARTAYTEALTLIAGIRESVDAFFDSVLVMDNNEAVRRNRLALLRAVSTLFTGFADFSRIAAE
jgi:glycyl-tRNA synthetase beta chain